jgi:hypothetical protein
MQNTTVTVKAYFESIDRSTLEEQSRVVGNSGNRHQSANALDLFSWPWTCLGSSIISVLKVLIVLVEIEGQERLIYFPKCTFCEGQWVSDVMP